MNFGFIKSMHGWTTPEKAQQLYELTLKAKPAVAVEIGVWGGRGSIAVALAMKQLGAGKVIAIDPWSREESAKGQVEPVSAEWWQSQDHDAVLKSFKWHLNRNGVDGFVEICRMTSDQAPVPKEIGLLIIDGNHGEQALADAKRFAPNVTLGGYCLLDDLDWTGGYVRQAEDFIKSLGFAFVRQVEGQTGLYQRIELAAPTDMTTTRDREIPDEPARLTIAYITSRDEPMFQWFFDSLHNQLEPQDKIKVIIVDLFADKRNKEAFETYGIPVQWVEPKPSIWQGKSRVTKEDWWAASNSRNTAICLCDTEWIAFSDDRCVLLPSWLAAVKKAMVENYIVVGSYEKRSKMSVEHGFIKGFEKLIGRDPRLDQAPNGKRNCAHSWFFTCAAAMPLEVALQINGFEEGCDGLSMEDSIFGLMLRNAGQTITYDPNMRMIEDRTEGECGPVMLRSSKENHPNDKDDKGHAALSRFGSRKRTEFTPDLRLLGEDFKLGRLWQSDLKRTPTDWFDGQQISEM